MNKNEIDNVKPIYKKEQAKNSFCNKLQKSPIANVLIVDDDEESTPLVLEILARRGIHADFVSDEKIAGDFFDRNDCDLAFISTQINTQADPSGQGADGFKLLQRIRANSLEMPVIMMAEAKKTKEQSPQRMVEMGIDAIRAGCCAFLVKPLDRQKIESLLDTFLPNHNVYNCDLVQQDAKVLYRIVGKSLKLAQTVELAKKIAPTSVPVLVSGESGTGKELISFLIHHNSRRAQGPYVRVNCAALSDTLLESELFGHEKGSFTGAYAQRKGRFEMAHGGTLLLDEVTETPIKFQAKLLRVLEQQDFERVGGNDSIRVDVRIISTTNKDLLQEVAEGRFRQDLYYRLSGVKLIIPPLRQRNEDLPDLVWHFVNLYAPQVGRHITKLAPAMMDIFAKYHWPGNIRQLRNAVLTSLILGTGPTLSLADVSWLFDELQPLPQENKLSISNSQSTVLSLVGMSLDQIERQVILNTLDHIGGNQTKAAKILGISDRTLRDKVRLYRQQSAMQLA